MSAHWTLDFGQKFLLIFSSPRDVNVGMDLSQMDESLYEAQWDGEEDYKPLANGNVVLD